MYFYSAYLLLCSSQRGISRYCVQNNFYTEYYVGYYTSLLQYKMKLKHFLPTRYINCTPPAQLCIVITEWSTMQATLVAMTDGRRRAKLTAAAIHGGLWSVKAYLSQRYPEKRTIQSLQITPHHTHLHHDLIWKTMTTKLSLDKCCEV